MVSVPALKTRPRLAALLLAAVCAGCATTPHGSGYWASHRGYDGNGDYGYDPAVSQAEAARYAAAAAGRTYKPPGTPDDPWGPYIVDASARFGVPERWVREVMRQESGGRLYDANGTLIAAPAGALGLMQVMPQTYDVLRQRYSLGNDPYDPHDNILAGTAYIHEMYGRYGSPAFLAAYNAGPDRLDAYLNGGEKLPDETVGYLASIAPRLGNEVAMTGPLAAYGYGGNVAAAYGGDSADRAYAGGGMTGAQYAARGQAPSAGDPSLQAYDGGGLVTQGSPTGVLTGTAPAQAPVEVAMAPAPRSNWSIQVGAFPDASTSATAIAVARVNAGDLVAGAQPAITPVQRAGLLYRARLVGLSPGNAGAACARLAGVGIQCFTVPPGA